MAIKYYKVYDKEKNKHLPKTYTKYHAEKEASVQRRNHDDSDRFEIHEDKEFYGHYLPKHFNKTSIINTKGRVI